MNDKLTDPPGGQRVFIGIPIDRPLQGHINELIKPIENQGVNISMVAEKNRHLTIAFLGNTAVADVEKLLHSFDKTYQHHPLFEFKLTMMTRFPGPAGRIIALTGDPDGQLDNLFGITQKLLQKHKIEYDRKGFRPHITLARTGNRKHLEPTFEQALNINMMVDRITLYQSTLTKYGSIYTSLKETQLGR